MNICMHIFVQMVASDRSVLNMKLYLLLYHNFILFNMFFCDTILKKGVSNVCSATMNGLKVRNAHMYSCTHVLTIVPSQSLFLKKKKIDLRGV